MPTLRCPNPSCGKPHVVSATAPPSQLLCDGCHAVIYERPLDHPVMMAAAMRGSAAEPRGCANAIRSAVWGATFLVILFVGCPGAMSVVYNRGVDADPFLRALAVMTVVICAYAFARVVDVLARIG